MADNLLPGQKLLAGAYLQSNDGRWRLYMQADGNLVLYGPIGHPSYAAQWATGTAGEGSVNTYAILQPDGNFVVYDHSRGRTGTNRIWASDKFCNNAFLLLQNDGNCVIYRPGADRPAGADISIWATGTVWQEPDEVETSDEDPYCCEVIYGPETGPYNETIYAQNYADAYRKCLAVMARRAGAGFSLSRGACPFDTEE